MSLTQEEKELYASFISDVYNGAVRANANNITPEVAGICDEMLGAIIQCSNGMIVPDAIFQVFYAKKPSSLRAVLKLIGKAAQTTVKQWVKIALTNQRYRNCIAATALNWKTRLEMALMGI